MSGVHQIALQTNSTLDNTGALFTRLNTVAKDMGKKQAINLRLMQQLQGLLNLIRKRKLIRLKAKKSVMKKSRPHRIGLRHKSKQQPKVAWH